MKNKFPTTCKDTKETVYNYKDYLETIHWKLLKENYLISGLVKTCQHCKKSNNPFEFYHRTYKRIGKEQLLDIIPVCKVCYEILLDKKHNLSESSWNTRKKSKKKSIRLQLKRFAFNPCKLSESEYNWLLEMNPKSRGCLLSKYYSEKVKAYHGTPQWINQQVSNTSKWIRKESTARAKR